MIVILGLLVGLLTVRLLVLGGRDVLEAPVLQRRNFRDRVLPTAAGLFVVIAALIIEAGRGTLGAFGLGDQPGLQHRAAARAVRVLRLRAARPHRRPARHRR